MIKSIIHYKPLKIDCCSIKFPWNWRCQSIINKINPRSDIILPNELSEKSLYYESHFISGVKIGYKRLYEDLSNNIEYLEYTTPSLSIALNLLQFNLNLPKIEIDDVNIINERFEYGSINCNNKYFGLYCNDEIIHNLSCGLAGPEASYIWHQNIFKQIITVKYETNHGIDIWDWERDLFTDNQEWQIRNINEII